MAGKPAFTYANGPSSVGVFNEGELIWEILSGLDYEWVCGLQDIVEPNTQGSFEAVYVGVKVTVFGAMSWGFSPTFNLQRLTRQKSHFIMAKTYLLKVR